MAKTLLDITQEILTVMSSDEVNSITDTAESESVARIVMSSFDAMVSNRNWPSHKKLIKLETFSDNSMPTHCRMPDAAKELLSLNYNKAKVGDSRLYYEPVKWKDNDAFLRLCNGRNSTKADILTVTDPTGIKLLIETDKHPEYFTSFDDKTIVFDSFDSEVDSTIHPDNMQARAYVQPEAMFSDTWEPDLPHEAIKGLIEEAKSTARYQLDAVSDQKAEQEAGRQSRWLSRKSWKVNGGIRYPNYGRRGKGGRRDATFERNN